MDRFLQILQEFGLTFVPLFVAMDAIGVLPILISVTQDMKAAERKKTILYAVLTALILGLAFVAVGKGIFVFLGIDVADFLVGGGLILFLLAAKDLITGKMIEAQASVGSDMVGVVPLGTPLVVGPAVLTTLLILIDQYNLAIVIISFMLNLAIAWVLLAQANRVVAFLGQGGVRATSKVVSLFLAAIAIKMVRQGILAIVG
ncbi:MAG: MarC family protein [Chloroflexi bacterium]|nr:MarC family protein [Chloroflexota bacterium]MBM3172502.1 MarC family protein [Chloroflexota bacterium]MBM3175501.1 MarC family protein [Chloroflexota bacterium]MBM4451219.1 MarC family protein [Chloroflexota bacterium]